MLRFCFRIAVLVAFSLYLTSCSASGNATSASQPSATSSPTASLSVEDAIKAAFSQSEPETRRAAVLTATQQFISQPSIQSLSDADATAAYNDLAFASGALTLADSTFIRRHGAYAIMGLPDGLGLYFFSPNVSPLEISRWTVGLTTVNPVWRDEKIAVPFETVGADGAIEAHFALLLPQETTWKLAWLSDDVPDWWFNARNASLTIEPNLSVIGVIGQAPDTTLAFDEDVDTVQRTYRMVWTWNDEKQVYEPDTPSENYSSRESWLWNISIPSPYATLVEFIERLQRSERDGLSRLVLTPEVIEDANDFGFQLINQSYKVILTEPERLVIQGHQGVFEFRFAAPQEAGNPWIITSIKVGADESQ